MTAIARRRARNLSVALFFALCFLLLDYASRAILLDPQALSGWTLAVATIILASYNLRKKFPIPPLGASASWLQFHIYLGAFTVLPFLLHAGLRAPTGILETILFMLYLVVAISGIVGLVLTRVLPRRLSSHGEEVIFERMGELRSRLGAAAEQLAESHIQKTGSMTVAKFYESDLREFFSDRKYFWRHLLGFDPPVKRMIKKIKDQNRYLNSEEQTVLGEIAEYVRAKDVLDYQWALQFALKAWLFVHLPATYSLLTFSLVHVYLVYAYAGMAL